MGPPAEVKDAYPLESKLHVTWMNNVGQTLQFLHVTLQISRGLL